MPASRLRKSCRATPEISGTVSTPNKTDSPRSTRSPWPNSPIQPCSR